LRLLLHGLCAITDPSSLSARTVTSSLPESFSKKGADANTEKVDRTPLLVAAENRDVEMMKLLLENRANPNCESVELGTPLYLSAYLGKRILFPFR
jgi:ankyrin repeat protein